VTSLILSVDPALDVAPFQQISDQLREFVERGELRPGDALPTVRQLASDLGVAPNTVARAYADLQEGGWLTSDGRRGTRVAEATPAGDARERASILRNDLDEIVVALRRRGYSKKEISAALRQTAHAL
jgi:DNA-binding transcriptional regulator YhcF (GntR family)